jgi:hypothetical protein
MPRAGWENPTPVIVLPPDTVIAAKSTILLVPAITGDIQSYQWTPAGVGGAAGANGATMQVMPDSTTTYRLSVSNTEGCQAVAQEKVAVFYAFIMPNAFTPDAGGRNGLFRVPPGIPVTVTRLSGKGRTRPLTAGSILEALPNID